MEHFYSKLHNAWRAGRYGCTEVWTCVSRLSMCAFSRAEKSFLVRLSVTISMNAFSLAGRLLYPRAETSLDERLFRTCCPYRCNTHAHDLELVKTVKMPSDDQTNSVISQTLFRVHGIHFFFRGNAPAEKRRPIYMESRRKRLIL